MLDTLALLGLLEEGLPRIPIEELKRTPFAMGHRRLPPFLQAGVAQVEVFALDLDAVKATATSSAFRVTAVGLVNGP